MPMEVVAAELTSFVSERTRQVVSSQNIRHLGLLVADCFRRRFWLGLSALFPGFTRPQALPGAHAIAWLESALFPGFTRLKLQFAKSLRFGVVDEHGCRNHCRLVTLVQRKFSSRSRSRDRTVLGPFGKVCELTTTRKPFSSHKGRGALGLRGSRFSPTKARILLYKHQSIPSELAR